MVQHLAQCSCPYPSASCPHFFNWDAGLWFLFSFMATVPLTKLLGEATVQLSIKLADTMSSLNASYGNAAEIIVGMATLLNGKLRIVQTSGDAPEHFTQSEWRRRTNTSSQSPFASGVRL
ncbi:hypothetical protein AZE42_11721 [Rhizopogon vesiculosus]|uniref:Uncharacterized protein n=1 Tax=Rhizopogon vesiculosus TaxID=180088 RepID=A0A1J8QX43_9AGAM|nr:hypothetical protein AZE42_11721 [Rhizopogon vesiculosus]